MDHWKGAALEDCLKAVEANHARLTLLEKRIAILEWMMVAGVVLVMLELWWVVP